MGYLFEHSLNEVWTLRQNLRYQQVDLDYNQIFSGDFQTDQRTVNRRVFVERSNTSGVVLDNQAQARLTLGQTKHTLLLGLDYRRTSFDRRSHWGDTLAIDAYAPVYGQPIVIPDPRDDKNILLNQAGVYAQNQIKFNQRWVGMIGGRWDNTTETTDDKLSNECVK